MPSAKLSLTEPYVVRVLEAMCGVAHPCGEAGRGPVHLGCSIFDAVGGLFGAVGAPVARVRLKFGTGSAGHEIDYSITEAVLRVPRISAIEYNRFSAARSLSSTSASTSHRAMPIAPKVAALRPSPCRRGSVHGAGPALGTRNDEVSREPGFTPEQIGLMFVRKVI